MCMHGESILVNLTKCNAVVGNITCSLYVPPVPVVGGYIPHPPVVPPLRVFTFDMKTKVDYHAKLKFQDQLQLQLQHVDLFSGKKVFAHSLKSNCRIMYFSNARSRSRS
jgi:hypothetical protein